VPVQVHLASRILKALDNKSQDTQREKEAIVMLGACLQAQSMLASGDVAAYSACLTTVLSNCGQLQPSTTASLLQCFNAEHFAMAVLSQRDAQGQDGDTVQESSSGAGGTLNVQVHVMPHHVAVNGQ
jgi:hypothetical protein